MNLSLKILLASAFTVASTSAYAAEGASSKVSYQRLQETLEISNDLNTYLQNFADIESLDNAIDTFFKTFVRNAPGLTAQKSMGAYNEGYRNQRANQVMRILRNDINNDGVVTPAEIDFANNERLEQYIQQEQRRGELDPARVEKTRIAYASGAQKLMEFDTNHDGEITFDEMRAFKASLPYRKEKLDPYTLFLRLDTNHDGTTTKQEATEALHKAFSIIDTNHNNVISTEEKKAFDETYYCAFKQPSEKAVLAGISAYSGPFSSTIATNGQQEEVSAGYIEIDPGTTPVYLTINSYDVVWKIGGAVDRIEHLNLLHFKGGIEGVPAGKVTLRNSDNFAQNCPSLGNSVLQKSRLSGENIFSKVSASLGKTTMMEFFNIRELPANQLPASISAPRYTVKYFTETAPQTADLPKDLFESFSGPHPQGFLKFDLNKVLSIQPAEPFKILAGQAGLEQLVLHGYLKQLDERGNNYLIVKEFSKLPAGLAGGNSRRFYIKKGLKPPISNHTHSCIYDEETKRPVPGQNSVLCR